MALYVLPGYWVDGYAEGDGEGFRATGGWDDIFLRRTDVVTKKRKELRLSERESEIIEEVAEEQARSGVADELVATKQLLRALERAQISYLEQHSQALAAYRDAYRNYEIATLMRAGEIQRQQQERMVLDARLREEDDEAAILLLM